MIEEVPESNWDSVQNFISDSPWQHEPLLKRIGQDMNALLGDNSDNYLLFDESAFTKKGKKSVGVCRQWNGRLGKVDNCQVGVFSVFGRDSLCAINDFRLFLPKEWTDDKKRCQLAGIPTHAYRKHQTKIDLALQMIAEAKDQQLNFNWIGADGFYGRDSHFRRSIAKMGLTFMVDIPRDTVIYLQNPKPAVPEKLSSKGRKPTLLKAQVKGIRLDKWLSEQAENDFEKLTIRKAKKGALKAQFIHARIWLWDGKSRKAESLHLVVRKDKGTTQSKVKYSVSNAAKETAIQRLAYMQSQRYWIEREFQDAKSQVGMADYQVRGWRAWHHHMAMVALAMLFVAQTKQEFKEQYEILSTADIKFILENILPRRIVSVEDIANTIQRRHDKRLKDIKLNHKT